MSTVPNLLNLANNAFGGDVVNRIAGALGENGTSIQSALGGVIPAVIGGLASKASTAQGAGDLVSLIKNNGLETGELANAASAVSSGDGITRMLNMGGPLLNSVLGSKAGGVIDWVTSLAGIKKSSATSLLSLATPVIMSLIGRHLGSSGGFNASSLMDLLGGQKQYLANAPAGLAGLLGFDAGAAPRAAAAYASERVAPAAAAATAGSSWWKWLLPLLILAGLLGYFLFRKGEEVPAVAVATPSPTVTMPPVMAPAVVTGLGEFGDVTLPDGTLIHIPANGVESKLLAFIKDPARGADRETWFSFDRLEFATDSSTLLPKSHEQLKNIAGILKAYPKVNLKIGGYTDNVGDPAHNFKLSSERANNTMNEIKSMGIAAARLTAEGYGEQHPIADNTTEEGRQKNRRIDVRVTAK